MAQKLTFSKVVILSFSRKPEGGTVKIACAPSKAVSKAMGWGEVPEWQKASTPTGSLAATLAMKVTYAKPPEQEELLTTEEQRQAVLEEND